MASHLIIVHGYSDGYSKPENNFKKLKKFLVENGCYRAENVHFVEYSSMDDQATYEDFADKLNADFERHIPKRTRVDILCHSTGALVSRIWLANRRRRQIEREEQCDLPVDRMFMFAPANFGSDLARMGQSFLGKARCTFFNTNKKKGNAGESGRIVLQGLEPASPFQWNLSSYDLHGQTYFGAKDPSGETCRPFVFAAGEGYGGVQSKILRARNKAGTDGTVRIPGTGMNTRKCRLYLSEEGAKIQWQKERKHAKIPFAVFQGFNHGSIIDPDSPRFLDTDGPGAMLLRAAKVKNDQQYRKAFDDFAQASENNYGTATGQAKNRYQQFFFKVRDDAGFRVEDFFLDFSVQLPFADEKLRKQLSREFDVVFEERVTAHSQDRSHRAFLINVSELWATIEKVRRNKGQVYLNVTAKKPYDEVAYDDGRFLVFDASRALGRQPRFIYENTTTLVEIVLNRRQSDEILKLRKRLG